MKFWASMLPYLILTGVLLALTGCVSGAIGALGFSLIWQAARSLWNDDA